MELHPGQFSLFDPGPEDPPWRRGFYEGNTVFHSTNDGRIMDRIRDQPKRMLHTGSLQSALDRGTSRRYMAALRVDEENLHPQVVSDMLANRVASNEDVKGSRTKHVSSGELGTAEAKSNVPAQVANSLWSGRIVPYLNQAEDKGSISYVGQAGSYVDRYSELVDHEDDLTHDTARELSLMRDVRRRNGIPPNTVELPEQRPLMNQPRQQSLAGGEINHWGNIDVPYPVKGAALTMLHAWTDLHREQHLSRQLEMDQRRREHGIDKS